MTTPPVGPPGSWQLSAELAPKKATPAAAEVAASPPAPSPLWKESTESVRTTVKWLVTALAAVGAVMFAKGFVTTPKLSWEDNRGQLGLAWVVGSVGVLAVGWLLYQAVQVLRPSAPELGNLPGGYKNLVNSQPQFYLPGDCPDFDTFLKKLNAVRRHARSAAGQFDQANSALEVSKSALAAAKVALDAAGAAKPPDQAAIAAAQAELKATQDAVKGPQKKFDQTQLADKAARAAQVVYEDSRKTLLDRAGFWMAANELTLSAWPMVLAATLAAVGGIGYQLLLATPDADEDEAAKPTPPAIGTLMQTDTDASRLLWDQLDLTGCSADADAAGIPVVVSSGKGTTADPYTVSTLTTPTCTAQTFTVIDDVAKVTVPTKVTIVYSTVAPCPSPSQTGGAAVSPGKCESPSE